MKNKTLLFVLCISCFFQFCKTVKYTPKDYPKSQIVFGNGGGITGVVTEFTLFENGQVFQKQGLGDQYTELDKLDKQQTKQLFDAFEALDLKSIDFNKPGNRYYFVGIKDQNSNHNITWNEQDQAEEKVKIIYQNLNSLVNPSSSFKKN